MSTDTMYFNSSRLISASSKNKTTTVARLDKKRMQAERKNKERQETMDVSLPEPQVLPNGEKPDFGNSKSRRKQRQSSSTKKQSGLSNLEKQAKNKEDTGKDATAKMTQDLKGLILNSQEARPKAQEVRPNSKSKRRGERKQTSRGREVDSFQGENVSKSSTSSNSPAEVPVSKPLPHFPNGNAPPIISPTLFPQSASISPFSANAGLYAGCPPTSPMLQLQNQQPHQPPMNHAGYPYGNYSLTAPHNAPQFMAPQTPLMNPMYPQPPLHHLPMMYKALDIQQREREHHHQGQHMSIPQYIQQDHPAYHSRPVSVPLGITEIPKVTEPPTVIGRSKPRNDQTQNTSFAGASFASKDPKVHKLPKPSFA